MDYFIMSIILVFFFYNLFLRSNVKKEWKELSPSSSILSYLCFGGAASYFGARIFELEWLYLIALYSVIGILVSERELNTVKKIVIAIFILFLLSIFRVPTDDSFKDHISSKDMYQCIRDYECVKITPKKTPDGRQETVVEILRIKGRSFEWKLFYAKGSLTLENDKGEEETLRGINIAGFWYDR